MPVSYIDIFRPQQLDATGQILAGGTNALTNALNNSIQIGRDSVNLRANQERDYLAERERNEALNQRKAEFLVNQINTDRSFNRHILEDERDFARGVLEDDRDYKFQVRTDIRDAALRKQDVDSLVTSRAADDTRADKVQKLQEDDTLAKTSFLKTRAEDLKERNKPPSFLSKLFGGDPERPPDDYLEEGNEARKIGYLLNDPDLVTLGDTLISKGTKGKIERERQDRYLGRGRTGTSKVPLTDEERLALVEGLIKDMSNPNVQLDKDLTQAARIKLNGLMREQKELRAKLAGKTTPGATTDATPDELWWKSLLKKRTPAATASSQPYKGNALTDPIKNPY